MAYVLCNFSQMGKVLIWEHVWHKDFGQGIVKLFELCLQDEVDKIDRLDMKRIVEEKNILA